MLQYFRHILQPPRQNPKRKKSEASKWLEYSGQISHGLLAMPRGSHQFIDPGSDELQVLVPCKAKTLNPKTFLSSMFLLLFSIHAPNLEDEL